MSSQPQLHDETPRDYQKLFDEVDYMDQELNNLKLENLQLKQQILTLQSQLMQDEFNRLDVAIKELQGKREQSNDSAD